MVNTQQNNGAKHKDAVSLIAAGAVIGAGVAVAATLALKNENNQQKVKKALSAVKNYAKESIDRLKKEPSLASGKKKIKAIVGEIKKD